MLGLPLQVQGADEGRSVHADGGNLGENQTQIRALTISGFSAASFAIFSEIIFFKQLLSKKA